MKDVKALIADDESLLRQSLRALLAETWPELVICGEAGNGREAMELISAHRPQIAFLDIRMPGLSGLEVAEAIGDCCHVVFVTAFDHYAVQAFEREALDYLLKPVSRERLQKTVTRLKEKLAAAPPRWPPDTTEALRRLLNGLTVEEGPQWIQYVRVQQGDGVRLIPVDEVIYFKASDKYTEVITRQGESLIRKSIKDLAGELDPGTFWQIHRGTIVNARFIARVSRSLTGRGVVKLTGRDETLTVSSRYVHLFKQM